MSPTDLALAGWVAAASLLTFTLTAWDKWKARRGGWRVRERTLLGLALAGGSPGLLFGMLLVRHKTRKPSFLWRFLLVLGAQAAVLYGILRA